MRYKSCSKCKKNKPATAEYYHRSKASIDGLRVDCKKCRKIESKNYINKNKQKIKEYKKKYRKNNINFILQQDKVYRENNKKKIKLANKNYYNKNKEKILSKKQEYYKQNKDVLLKKVREYRKDNIDKLRKQDRKSYLKNIESKKIAKKKYYNKNKDKFIARANQRMYRKSGAVSDFTDNDWKKVLLEFNYSCAYCNKKTNYLEREHVVPVYEGGAYTSSNIIPSCRLCNRRKDTKDFESWYRNYKHYSLKREIKIKEWLKNN